MAGKKQFAVPAALTSATTAFWRAGYADTSVDSLCTATGLGRGSLYGTFGGKDALFRSALEDYGKRYGDQYDAALAAHPDDPAGAVEAFLEVALNRILDPDLPEGCLIAQSAAEIAALTPDSADLVRTLVDRQRTRVRAALGKPADPALDDLTSFVVAVNQSLAVMSRAGAGEAELRAIAGLAVRTVHAGTES
ncbi:TetR/AcrR family transcriptional regulator [Amycolatopsis jejuensis]|uniref:TetR/AcrR family transcriptional regulator n=1 Tax=Amycolatopsis jejuensis TaxID=330084 RepID=UPI000524232A|nr:TetR/AcrR family transcriptional regulator [Amycolatopsis jejuensis]